MEDIQNILAFKDCCVRYDSNVHRYRVRIILIPSIKSSKYLTKDITCAKLTFEFLASKGITFKTIPVGSYADLDRAETVYGNICQHIWAYYEMKLRLKKGRLLVNG